LPRSEEQLAERYLECLLSAFRVGLDRARFKRQAVAIRLFLVGSQVLVFYIRTCHPAHATTGPPRRVDFTLVDQILFPNRRSLRMPSTQWPDLLSFFPPISHCSFPFLQLVRPTFVSTSLFRRCCHCVPPLYFTSFHQAVPAICAALPFAEISVF